MADAKENTTHAKNLPASVFVKLLQHLICMILSGNQKWIINFPQNLSLAYFSLLLTTTHSYTARSSKWSKVRFLEPDV